MVSDVKTHRGKLFLPVMLFVVFAASGAAQSAENTELLAKVELGQSLFFDKNLSKNRTQACATCHNPEKGFVDNRDNGVGGAVSLGDDGHSLGDRNAPTAAYAMFSPDFHKNKQGEYKGGQFLDGREANLAGQAGGPPPNPVEMGMADKAAVVKRLMENPTYVERFKSVFGNDVFLQPDAAYQAMTESIAAFEQTPQFSPFDSKYDRYIRGEYEMTEQEELGMTLFFSEQFTNCNACHQLKGLPNREGETFSSYEFHNIGVPVNQAVRSANGKGTQYVDHGLLENPQVKDPAQDGKFKTATLRNVAVTGPYMHNGVFKELKTVVLFYDKYNNRKAGRQINPETGKPWGKPEVPETVDLEKLEKGPALKDSRVDALLAFLKTLTDKRYEHLLVK